MSESERDRAQATSSKTRGEHRSLPRHLPRSIQRPPPLRPRPRPNPAVSHRADRQLRRSATAAPPARRTPHDQRSARAGVFCRIVMRGLSAPSSANTSSSTSESSPPASPSISSGILDMFSASACTRPIPQTWAALCSRREVVTHSRLSHRCLPCPSVVRPSPPGVSPSPSPSPSPSGTSGRYGTGPTRLFKKRGHVDRGRVAVCGHWRVHLGGQHHRRACALRPPIRCGPANG